ncbi:hypothetical protein HMPREF1981_01276 [Bacteroides pyogenes F0041]|uniref:Uncharacterized protein n=1 Tax=Bacteroides pyogenes F0041 TaxID=1321819 RepID=U2C5V3_9BACE|nr:hypothetical protein HMPREF1981_01276 [Bacteroides pyogenes F0041]
MLTIYTHRAIHIYSHAPMYTSHTSPIPTAKSVSAYTRQTPACLTV